MIPTYIPNLDNILEGGFDKPSVVLIAGPAGSGKTTFAAQSLFNAAKSNEGRSLFISTLSEPPVMINRYMSRFTFFDQNLFETDKMNIFNIGSSLLKQGTSVILDFMNKKISLLKPSRIAIDPLTVLGDILRSKEEPMTDYERRSFYFDLFTSMKSWNTFVLITGEFTLDELRKSMVGYLADGIIYLSEEIVGMRAERHLRILKMRGQKYISGSHSFDIREEGIIVFPRLLPRIWVEKTAPSIRVSTGVSGLDAMLNGGILKSDNLLISGTTGTGKTTFGLYFINKGLMEGENSLVISFEERPSKIVRNARAFGLELEPYVEKKMLEIIYIPPVRYYPHEQALIITRKIKQNNVKRILLDGLKNLEEAIPDVLQRKNYVTTLLDNFSCMGVTTVITTEIPELFGAVKLTHEALSGIIDNIILLRSVEIDGKMHGVLSILKSRGTKHDPEIREFEITTKGIHVKTTMKGYENILTGSARKTPVEVFRETFGERH